MENELVYARKYSKARCCMSSHIEKHQQVQEEADWLKQSAVPVQKIKLEILQRQLHECIQQTLSVSIPQQQNLHGSARPNTDCLAASNGVCTKRNTPRLCF